MIKKTIAALSLAAAMVATTGVASANDLVDTNVKQRVECLFYSYVWEGGEYGLECLT